MRQGDLEDRLRPVQRADGEQRERRGLAVWYSASADAIFIGWYWVVNSLPWVSPVMTTATAPTIAVIAPP